MLAVSDDQAYKGRSGAQWTNDADKLGRKGRSGAEGSVGPGARNGKKEVEPEGRRFNNSNDERKGGRESSSRSGVIAHVQYKGMESL